ncbi:hypothetical protein QY96_00740 [Bacillus thermotolerans]|nr:hypothetical protein QY96_00740 [Bacillus thermotolerans]
MYIFPFEDNDIERRKEIGLDKEEETHGNERHTEADTITSCVRSNDTWRRNRLKD